MAHETEAIAAHWKRFGEWLEAQRLSVPGLSATEAARRADMHLTTWSRLENGQTGTRRNTLPRILEALGIDESDPRYIECYKIAGFGRQSPRSIFPRE